MAASLLKHYRIDKGLTLFDLGRKTGIQPGRLSQIERGLVTPRAEEIERLSRALRAKPAELFHKRSATLNKRSFTITPVASIDRRSGPTQRRKK